MYLNTHFPRSFEYVCMHLLLLCRGAGCGGDCSGSGGTRAACGPATGAARRHSKSHWLLVRTLCVHPELCLLAAKYSFLRRDCQVHRTQRRWPNRTTEQNWARSHLINGFDTLYTRRMPEEYIHALLNKFMPECHYIFNFWFVTLMHFNHNLSIMVFEFLQIHAFHSLVNLL